MVIKNEKNDLICKIDLSDNTMLGSLVEMDNVRALNIQILDTE